MEAVQLSYVTVDGPDPKKNLDRESKIGKAQADVTDRAGDTDGTLGLWVRPLQQGAMRQPIRGCSTARTQLGEECRELTSTLLP